MKYIIWFMPSPSPTDSKLWIKFCGTKGRSHLLGSFTNLKDNPQSHFIFETNNDIGDIARMDYWTDLSGTDIELYVGVYVLQYPEPPTPSGWLFEIFNKFTEGTTGRIQGSVKRRPNQGENETDVPKLEDCGFPSGEQPPWT